MVVGVVFFGVVAVVTSTATIGCSCPVVVVEGSLEVKLPTVWTDEKQSRAEAERREKIRRENSRRERVRRKKMQMREEVGKSRNTVFFQ